MPEQEVLVIASKVKAYVTANGAGMRMSGDVTAQLTTILARALDKGISLAQADKRQTLKARDIVLPVELTNA